MEICQISKSISYEGMQSGRPAIIIETYGCPLDCSWCDVSKDASHSEMSVPEIVSKVNKISQECRYVIFTGGEPLAQPDCIHLLYTLAQIGYHIEIETSGAIDISAIAGLANLIISMDWKCSSSKMADKMLESNLSKLTSHDALKFTIGSIDDLEDLKRTYSKTRAQIIVMPVLNTVELQDIIDYIIDNQLNDVKFQLQIDKYI